MRRAVALCAVLIALLPAAASAVAQESPFVSARLFEQTCAACHGNPAFERAPDRATLRRMTPEAIYDSLTTGSMRVQAQDLADDAKRAIAEYLADRKLGVAQITDAMLIANRCAATPPLDPTAVSAWNGWGVDLMNTRYQPSEGARLSASQVPRLKLRWAFGFPGTASVQGQPTLVAGRVFVGVDTGHVYALDAASGCVHWAFRAPAGVRGAVSVGPLTGQGSPRYSAYFGDMRGNVYAVDAASGQLRWTVSVDDHPLARITGAPQLHGNRLYVPVSAHEEDVAANPTYPCCTFRGSVVALDADTGRQIWKTYIIPEAPRPTRKNSKGTQLWAPAGGAVWSAPTIDPQNHALYVGTGDGYTQPAPRTTDAIMALDMDTGKVLWVKQDTENDVWLFGCLPSNPSENCPQDVGTDQDFGASPILKTLPDGRRILVAGQKNGIVWAHDPDREGAVVWKTDVSGMRPDPRGEIVWGGAADEASAYFGLNSGGLVAVRLTNGEQKWFTPLEPEPGSGQRRGQSSAVTAIPGVVFSGGWDGMVRAFSADNGRLLWEYNTLQQFKTVNGVAAKGGSMGAPGPTVAGGMLFVPSGYVGVQNGLPGNVLLAFSVP